MATNRTRRFVNAVKLTITDGAAASGDPCLCGQISGIALDAKDTSNRAVVARAGAFRVSVNGANDSGNTAIAAGDRVYYVSGDTPVLSAKTSGVLFGWAMESVDTGTTQSIQVALSGGAESSTAPPPAASGVAGDGSDGAVHLATNTDLTAPVNATTIVIDAGVRVNTNGFDVRATTSITNSGTIADFQLSTPNSAGPKGKTGFNGDDTNHPGEGGVITRPATAIYSVGKSGGAATTTVGNNGLGTAASAIPSDGTPHAGNGGTGAAGGNAGGIGGTLQDSFSAGNGISIHSSLILLQGLDGGAGGGAGGGDSTLLGGGGGAGGGYIVLVAPVIINAGAIDCAGGNGGDGDAAGDCGGGGGGTGGAVITIGAFSGNAPNVSGGTGGLGKGTGTNGANGVAGIWDRFSV